MPPEDAAYAADWMAAAQTDLTRVQRRLDEGDVADAAFHLQQAVEKALKGYLLSKGWTLKRTHNLGLLLEEAIRRRADLAEFAEMCREVTSFYFADRYPAFVVSPTTDEVARAHAQAGRLIGEITRETL